MLGNLGFSDFTWAHVRMCHEMIQALDQRAWKTKTWRSKPGPALLCVYVDIWWCFFPQVDAPIFQLNLKSSKSRSTSLNRKKYRKKTTNPIEIHHLALPFSSQLRSHNVLCFTSWRILSEWNQWNRGNGGNFRIFRPWTKTPEPFGVASGRKPPSRVVDEMSWTLRLSMSWDYHWSP